MSEPRQRRDEGLFVLAFVALCVAYFAAAKSLGVLMDHLGGETAVELMLRPKGSESGIVTAFNLPRAIVRGGFCLLVARNVGYHRRDAVWAAVPSVAAPYFAFKIAWRFVNLLFGNRYWEPAAVAEQQPMVT